MGLPQLFAGEWLLRGVGEPTRKSPALLSVSVQPPSFRSAAVVFAIVAVGPLPSKQVMALPYPTKSTICEFGSGQVLPKIDVPGCVKKTFPAGEIFIGGASGIGLKKGKKKSAGTDWPLELAGPNPIRR